MCLMLAPGVHLTNIPGTECQYGALLQLATDGLEGADLIDTKKPGGHRVCRQCNAISTQINEPYDFFSSKCGALSTTLESHERDCKLLVECEKHGWSKADLSKWFRLNGAENAFSGIVPGLPFDYVRLAPYDHLMHNEV